MSQENVEVVRRALEAFRRRDWESLIALFDPDIEWRDRPESGLGTFHGHDGVMRFFQTILEAWEHFDARAEDIIGAGDQVVVFIHQTARGSASGVDVEERIAQVFRLRGGRVCYARIYTDRNEALEAVGLRD